MQQSSTRFKPSLSLINVLQQRCAHDRPPRLHIHTHTSAFYSLRMFLITCGESCLMIEPLGGAVRDLSEVPVGVSRYALTFSAPAFPNAFWLTIRPQAWIQLGYACSQRCRPPHHQACNSLPFSTQGQPPGPTLHYNGSKGVRRSSSSYTASAGLPAAAPGQH
jgi:hypothetical protein